ncbi:MAG: ATP phosphoribosyltransferase regulatory subunit [Oscillospiraceae bacterium]
MNRFAIATPRGTADRLFAGGKQLRDCEQQIRQVLSRRGYHEAVTPCVEYYDVFLQAESPLDQEEMFKLVDDNGRLLVIRPDSTTPLARVAATRLSNEELPLRLYYVQNVLRAHTGNGHPREIYQAGAELMGAGGVLADLDILTAACQVLECSGVRDYCIELGHAGIYQELIAQLGAGDEAQEEIRHLVERKAFAALGDLLSYAQSRAIGRAGHAAAVHPQGAGKMQPLTRTGRCWVPVLSGSGLCRTGPGWLKHITIDLGLVHEMGYYTGILFRGYLSAQEAQSSPAAV